MRLALTLALGVLVLPVYVSCCLTRDTPVDRSAAELDIAEEVFRHLFEHNHSQAQGNAKAYFLQIDGKDPDATFLARFAGQAPPIRKGSEFQEGEGLLFRVSELTWLEDGRVKATGGYHEASRSASSSTFHLARICWKGIWAVDNVGPGSIS
jgi:hypothetical protein